MNGFENRLAWNETLHYRSSKDKHSIFLANTSFNDVKVQGLIS